MYLKNIEVQGFKSFAQKMNFVFHDGITAIVGPNGSGKSNIADAVRWVLGEQSARQLRGGHMQDVIFAGTNNRKALSYASVALTLDNADHVLPIEYEELTVTRRLYRSGESEYLINGSACRLKDIQELFYDTGIGKEGYSIIGQGQIDQILSSKPEDRRELFDEAAGIVKLKRRKNTTLKKLEEEQQNLARLTDILGEISRQLEPLKKQEETARTFLKKRDELRALEANLLLQDMKQLDEKISEVTRKKELAAANLEETRRKFEETKQEYQHLEKEREQAEAQIESLRTAVESLSLQTQKIEGARTLCQEQIRTETENRENGRSREEVLKREIEEKNQTLKNYEQEHASLSAKLKDTEKEQEELHKQLTDVRSEIEELSQAVEDGKSEVIELLNQRSHTRGEMQRFDTMQEQLESRNAQIGEELQQVDSDRNKQEQLLMQAQKEEERVRSQIADQTMLGKEREAQLKALENTRKKQREQIEAGQADYHREASRLESLRNIAERYDGYSNSIRKVMERRKECPGLCGVTADLIQTPKQYEIAIETALGGNIQNIVTDNEQTAKEMIAYLKSNRFGRATFLPLTTIRSRGPFSPREALREEGVIAIASELVEAEEPYHELVQYLLGRTLVIDQIDHALAIGRKYKFNLRMVTLEGESVNPGGSMTGGAYRNTGNLLGRRREIEELEAHVQEHSRKLLALQQQNAETGRQRDRLQQEAAQSQQALQEYRISLSSIQLKIEQIAGKKQELTASYDRMQREREDLKTQESQLSDQSSQISQALEQSQQQEKELETTISYRQEELEAAQRQEQILQKSLEELRLAYAQASQKTAFAGENRQRIRRELLSQEEELAGTRKALDAQNEEIERKNKELEELVQELDQTKKQSSQKQEALARTQAGKEKLDQNHQSFFEERDALSGQMNLLDRECFRLNSQIEKWDEQRDIRINYMWENYEITPVSARDYQSEEQTERSALQKAVDQTKNEIRDLGNVNVNAIEEYQELQERHSFLSVQYQDLAEAEQSLEDVIERLDTGMRQQFRENFKDIQREFNQTFQELFGGGSGTLELMEDVDILEAGIRVIAQPPGKKLQNMMQLSGGEKAMTAIALLFAFQNLKPSPFCLLDEIEAALDDANVVRFAAYLKKLTKHTQFIIITHRRGTMNAADRLYGITMQEKGVSALVSVDLVESELEQ